MISSLKFILVIIITIIIIFNTVKSKLKIWIKSLPFFLFSFYNLVLFLRRLRSLLLIHKWSSRRTRWAI